MKDSTRTIQDKPSKGDGGFDLITSIFKKAYRVWERHNGMVPPDVLQQLDEAGDWPRGLAAAVMKRLNRDQTLREQLRELLNG